MRFFLAVLLLTSCSSLDDRPVVQSVPHIAPTSTTVLLDHGYFRIQYDKKFRLPKYVSYQITAEGLRAARAKRRNRFIPDALLVKQGIDAVTQKDYVHSGYDKGHMAPAASFSYSQEANDATFVMSNMVPQSPDLNRHAWKDLEALERRLGCGEERIQVFTGPVLEAGLEVLPSGIPIPKRFFKLVIDDTPPRKAIAFVYSQQDKAAKAGERVVSPRETERLIGEDFESTVPERERGIFRVSAPLAQWKQQDCAPTRARKALTRK